MRYHPSYPIKKNVPFLFFTFFPTWTLHQWYLWFIAEEAILEQGGLPEVVIRAPKHAVQGRRATGQSEMLRSGMSPAHQWQQGPDENKQEEESFD